MRIVHVISSIDPRAGGPVTALVGLTEALTAAGGQVTVVSTWRQGNDLQVADRLRHAGVTVEIVGPTCTPLQYHRDLKPTLKRIIANADIVHIHGLWENIQHHAARIAQAHKVPYVIRPCGMLDPWSLKQSQLRKKIYLRLRLQQNLCHAAAIHYTTQTEQRLANPLTENKTYFIEPNGLDLNEIPTTSPTGFLRQRIPSLGTRPIVLFLSRLHHKKGLDLLIPAFADVSTDSVLVLAGPCDDAYRAQLEQMIAKHHVTDRIFFAGMLHGSERFAAMAGAAIYVLPSYQENFGISVIEALACGLPVIISDQVNIHDEITNAQVGQVIPTEISALTAAIDRWLGNPELRQAAGQRARTFARTQYDWNHIAENWMRHYRALIEASR